MHVAGQITGQNQGHTCDFIRFPQPAQRRSHAVLYARLDNVEFEFHGGFYAGFELSAVVAFILSPIIIGYLFAQKICEENKTRTIAKITILFTLLVMVTVLIENAASADWNPMTKENYINANPTATPSTTDWYYIERLAIVQEDFSVIVLLLALTFIGLYVGSTLKKPAKT